jgi:hypothetical protein
MATAGLKRAMISHLCLYMVFTEAKKEFVAGRGHEHCTNRERGNDGWESRPAVV